MSSTNQPHVSLDNASTIEGEKVEKEVDKDVEIVDDSTTKPNNNAALNNSSTKCKSSDGKRRLSRLKEKGVKKANEKLSKQLQCVVCLKKTRCKYNILRNNDTKHLCDDVCFKTFKSNPASYLALPSSSLLAQSSTATPTTPTTSSSSTTTRNPNPPKTCDSCQQPVPGSGKGITWKVGPYFKTFCSSTCLEKKKGPAKACALCFKNLTNDGSAFVAPVTNEGLKDFCSHKCLAKYEDFNINKQKEEDKIKSLSSDVLTNAINLLTKCYSCQNSTICKFELGKGNLLKRFCSDKCVLAFRVSERCEMCKCTLNSNNKKLTKLFEGVDYSLCSVTCLNTFVAKHHKLVPCSWCNIRKSCFEMIEKQDASNSKVQYYCSLNCLSLYRVNVQANSNVKVTCDYCMKFAPAQYHLSMSDASVRNFCGYPCVLAFQNKFVETKGPESATIKILSTSSATKPSFTLPTAKTSTTSLAAMTSCTSSATTAATNCVAPEISEEASNEEGLSACKVIIKPPPPKEVKNKALICKPIIHTKFTQCKIHCASKSTQTDGELCPKKIIVPVPVPMMLPTPMNMYTSPTPYPVIIPVPVPVPCFIPTTKASAQGIMKKIKDLQEKLPSDPFQAELLMMAEAVAGVSKASDNEEDDEEETVSAAHNNAVEEDMLTIALRMASEMAREQDVGSSNMSVTNKINRNHELVMNTYSTIDTTSDVIQHSIMTSDAGLNDVRSRGVKRKSSHGQKSRVSVNNATTANNTIMSMANNKNPMEHSAKKYKMDDASVNSYQQQSLKQQQQQQVEPISDASYVLKFSYGVNAYKHWVGQKNAQIEASYQQYKRLHPSVALTRGPRFFKLDLLHAPSVELNQALSMFVKEVRKPNGEDYAPDSILYLCLGIQEYMYENGRIDNIFTDYFYDKFNENLNEILSHYEVRLNAQGMLVCRIEEEHLWESKQLGAHSPHVLLNTLLYFNSKYFLLKTPQEHVNLSFSNIVKHWKRSTTSNGRQGKSVYLRYYMNPSHAVASMSGSAVGSVDKKKVKEDAAYLEQAENAENPLRCPVKLYEFYISKCPDSIKNRTDLFYLTPERSCVPDSPVWYSTQPQNIENISKMFNRLRVVREVQEAHLSNMAPTYHA
ncbi:hypothetical protein HELRODRAFT_194612 [Helobdella robusta]|uniref:TRASH domain-containing protein n=1 Tax=Helobdella robusta TaxID=6412 RepID=T1FW88_HELRO|nr:hypothetical protein HELRODRAFT_194612 [Helobdella robusta]ESN90900.1 hypothetical protein HELRODRAFT_194612 [Helobdella robusta]